MSNAAKTTGTNRKGDLYDAARSYGQEASLVAHVILNWHTRPSRKLAGLVKLLGRGQSVRTSETNMCVLVIDGSVATWSGLESVK